MLTEAELTERYEAGLRAYAQRTGGGVIRGTRDPLAVEEINEAGERLRTQAEVLGRNLIADLRSAGALPTAEVR